MHSSAKLGLGIAVAWIAGIFLFIAFHPGGIQMEGPHGIVPAGNPVDVLKYLLTNRGKVGNFGKDGNSSGQLVGETGTLSQAQQDYQQSNPETNGNGNQDSISYAV